MSTRDERQQSRKAKCEEYSSLFIFFVSILVTHQIWADGCDRLGLTQIGNFAARENVVYVVTRSSLYFPNLQPPWRVVNHCTNLKADENGYFPSLIGIEVTNTSGTDASVCVGNPVDISNGNKVQIETDYVGGGPFPLVFERSYNSQIKEAGPFGKNWRHTYEARLQITRPNNLQGSTLVVAKRQSGQDWYFMKPFADQPWLSVNKGFKQVTVKEIQNGIELAQGGVTERYDDKGLLQVLSKFGMKQTFSYNPQGQLMEARDLGGRTLRFFYDEGGQLKALQDPAGGFYRYQQDERQNLVVVTYPDDSKRQYRYEGSPSSHLLTGILDENNRKFASWAYDEQGRAILSEHAGGVDRTNVTYHSDGRTTVTNALGKKTTYHFETFNGLKRVVEVKGAPTESCEGTQQKYNYYPSGLLKSSTDWNGNVTEYQYNERGLENERVEAVGKPEERSILTHWHETLAFPKERLYANTKFEFAYDEVGRLIQEDKRDLKQEKSRTYRYAYNTEGLLQEVDGPRTDVSDIVTFEYDEHKNLTKIHDAVGLSTRITSYNAHGLPLAIEEPSGKTIELTYDERNRLVERKVNGESTTFHYNKAGQLKKIISPTGKILKYLYDPAHRLIAFRNHGKEMIEYILDAAGNQREEKMTHDGEMTYLERHTFDEESRLLKEIGAEGQWFQHTYDPNGNRLSTINALQQVHRFRYDPFNRLSGHLDPLNGKTIYHYNPASKVSEIIDSKGKSTEYHYDGLENLLLTKSAVTGKTSYQYDAAGNKTGIRFANGQTIQFKYDANNRLVQISTPTQQTQYSYDEGKNAAHQLTGVKDTHSQLKLTYDAFGNVSKATSEFPHLSLKTLYDYDADSQLERMTYPSGMQISYHRNAAGKIISVTMNEKTLLSQIRYLPFGPLTSYQLGNGLAVNRHYDQSYRLVENNSKLKKTKYQYLENDLIKVMGSVVLGYDHAGRLTHATDDKTKHQYQYDAEQDRLKYDPNGNLTHRGKHEFHYNAQNQLVKVTESDKTIATYEYNGLGQRVAKHTAQEHTFFIYNPESQLIGEANGKGEMTEYVYLDQEPIAMIKEGKVYYYLNDHLGTPQMMTDEEQTIVWQAEYEPYGKAQMVKAAVPNSFRFPGQYYDSETGLHYNLHRYYDPEVGRYITPDPIGLAGGLDLYAYAKQNPFKYVDPKGLDVTVTLYPGAGGLRHVGIGVNSSQTMGFYPAEEASLLKVMTGQPVPGIMLPDTRTPIQSITIPTTPTQDQTIQAFINNRMSNPGLYDLNERNCATTVHDALEAGGINVSMAIRPKYLMENLQRQFGSLQ